jgi:hypothetical protein
MKRISSTTWLMITGAIAALTFIVSNFRFSHIFLITFLILLISLSNILLKENARYAEQNKTRPQIIQFSIARLLLATSIVAFVFGIPRLLSDNLYKDWGAVFSISVIAFAFGSLALISKKDDFKHISVIICLVIVIFAAIGIIAALMVQLPHSQVR